VRSVGRKRCGNYFGFGQYTAANIGRQDRHRRMVTRTMIVVAPIFVTAPHSWNKRLQHFQASGTDRDEVRYIELPLE
jgi:hypothetical protein